MSCLGTNFRFLLDALLAISVKYTSYAWEVKVIVSENFYNFKSESTALYKFWNMDSRYLKCLLIYLPSCKLRSLLRLVKYSICVSFTVNEYDIKMIFYVKWIGKREKPLRHVNKLHTPMSQNIKVTWGAERKVIPVYSHKRKNFRRYFIIFI